MNNLSLSEKMIAYNLRKLDSSKIWILFFFLGWSYGSMNQGWKQFFFYLTFGGFGIWTLYRLFTLNRKIKKFNKKIAIEIGFTIDELSIIGF